MDILGYENLSHDFLILSKKKIWSLIVKELIKGCQPVDVPYFGLFLQFILFYINIYLP